MSAILHHNLVLLADKNLHVIKEFPNNTNDIARLCKFMKLSILETKDKIKLQSLNFPLNHKKIKSQLLQITMVRKSKILLLLYILFSPFIDSNFKTVFTNNL